MLGKVYCISGATAHIKMDRMYELMGKQEKKMCITSFLPA